MNVLRGVEGIRVGSTDNALYHQWEDVYGASQLECFRRSVAEFHLKHVEQTMPIETSRSMDIGSMVHLLLLEPGLFNKLVETVEEVPSKATISGKKWWAEKMKESPGKIVVSASMTEKAVAIAESVRENEMAMKLLGKEEWASPGILYEQAFAWRHAVYGIRLKCKPDVLHSNSPTIVHLKTAANACPGEFSRATANFGYHRSAALYRAGIACVFGASWREVVDYHVVVQTTEPYETVVYRMSDTAIGIGAMQMEKAIRELSDCLAFDSWKSRYAGCVNELDIPKWAQYEE